MYVLVTQWFNIIIFFFYYNIVLYFPIMKFTLLWTRLIWVELRYRLIVYNNQFTMHLKMEYELEIKLMGVKMKLIMEVVCSYSMVAAAAVAVD